MPEALTIGVHRERGYTIVTPAGEIDIATVTRLRECLFKLASDGHPLIADLGHRRLHRLRGARRAGRRGQADRRVRRQPVSGLRPAEDPPAVPADRAGPPPTPGPHTRRSPASPGGGPDHSPLAS